MCASRSTACIRCRGAQRSNCSVEQCTLHSCVALMSAVLSCISICLCLNMSVHACRRVNFAVAGTGLTPALAIVRAILLAEQNTKLQICMVFANKTVSAVLDVRFLGCCACACTCGSSLLLWSVEPRSAPHLCSLCVC